MRRHLTPDEITYILKDLDTPKVLLPKVKEHVRNNALTLFRKQLSRVSVHPESIEEIKKVVEHIYASSFVPPGEMVGILAGQSMESYTQITLNMFHFAGKNTSLGLPRFEEILNATSHPKVIGFVFVPLNMYDNQDRLRHDVRLPEIKLENIAIRHKVFKREDVNTDLEDTYSLLYTDEFKRAEWCVQITLDLEKLYNYSITPGFVAREIEKQLDSVFVVYDPIHPHSTGILNVYVDTTGIMLDDATSVDQARKMYLYDITIPTLYSITLSGIKGVEAIYVKNVETEEDPLYVLEGNGGSLIDLLSHPMCNSRETTNDNMWDVLECLGIEAARAFLIEEITKIMSFDGTYVNPKHVLLVMDRMTLDGTITSFNRYGMTEEYFGPVGKLAFEECVPNTIKAGINSAPDSLKGISGSLITGKPPRAGANGICDVLIDLHKLDSVIEEEPDFVEL